jgi:hypothetical protein
MKLIFCPACKDVLRLVVSKKPRSCMCGLSWGRYLKNKKDATIGGLAIPIGIDNKSFAQAVKKRTAHQKDAHNEFLYFTVAHPFNAFVIPRICSTVKDDK